MTNAYDLDQGHSKSETDTKERPIEITQDRYPIGVQLTVDEGGGLWTCVELDGTGNPLDPEIEHTEVGNVGTAILSLNVKIVMYWNSIDRNFYFNEIN